MARISFDNLSKADGSALIDEDGTIVQASVFGPVDISQSKINYEEAVVEILFKPKVNIAPSSPAFDSIREIENLLKGVFKEVIITRLHPRTSISIMIQEIYDGGCLLSAAINAVCCALIDAGLPMKCPVSGVSIKLDQPAEESNKVAKRSSFDLVFDNRLNLITILTRGCVDEADLQTAIEMGKQRATKHFDTIRTKIRERFGC